MRGQAPPASRSLALSAPGPRAPEGSSDTLLSGLSAFAAQLMGQGGRKRGLKGGPPVLGEAKSAYLEAEYSGPNDRRARTGRITRTEV